MATKANWKVYILWGVIGLASVIIGNNLPAKYGPVWQRILISAVAGAVVAVLLAVVIWAVTGKRKA